MKTVARPLLALAIAFGCGYAACSQTTTQLSPLSSFGDNGDGSIRPGADPSLYPPMTIGTSSTGYQRGYAYDPRTGFAVLVDPNAGSAGTNANFQGGVYVIDGITGTNVSTLSTNGIYGGTYPASALSVADDGAVFMCNQINSSSTGALIIYRWGSVWQSNVPPSIAYSNTIVPNQRYGATMDVRGAGTNTQIILGSKAQGGSSGTNVTIFTTADGTNFTAIPLATTITTADFADGIAFGPTNTFWAKSTGGHALRLMSFNLAASNTTLLATFGTNTLPGIADLGALALELTNKLMAALEAVPKATGPQRVWLFDISATLANPTNMPLLQDIKPFPTDNLLATAPSGFLHFGGTNVYAHAVNNGLLTLSAGPVATPAPQWVVQPVASQNLVATRTATFQALAYPAVTYQWMKNGTNILNATNATLSIANLTTNDSGTYSVIVSNNSGSFLTSTDSKLSVVSLQDSYHLNTLWSAGASSGAVYINNSGGANTPNQRTIAYNALSNELYVVSKSSGYTIYALNATNISATPPDPIKTLNVTGISGGNTLTLCAIGVADDGAIYACNVDTSLNWKLYRWTNSDPATAPILVFQGDPTGLNTGFRWGDVMSVRGSGTNTQIVIDNNNSTWYTVILTPTDSSMTSFSPALYWPTTTFTTGIGRSLDFGDGNTVWQKRKALALVQSAYDPTQPGAMTTVASYSGFPSGLAGVTLSLDRNLAAGVNFGSSPSATLDIFDVSDLTSPLTISQYAFPIAKQSNANNIGQTIISGNYLFTLDANNGIMAFQIVPGAPTPPDFVQPPQDIRLLQGGSGALTVVPDQTVTLYQWQRSGTNLASGTASSYPFTNAQPGDAGLYRCIVSNVYGMGTSSVATVSVTLTNDTYHVVPLWSTAPGTQPYATTLGGSSSPWERSLAYNALSNQVLVAQCPPSTGALSVYVLDAATGSLLYTLNTNGIAHQGSSEVSGSNPIDLVSITVGSDGAVYACNASPNSSGGSGSDPAKMFRVYRWADSGSNTAPALVYIGDPSATTANRRWGDAMDARGSGITSQLLLDSQDGGYGAVLVPTDGTLTAFTNYWWSIFPLNGLGRSLQFATGNSYYGKHYGTALRLASVDTNSNTSSILASYGIFASTVGGVTLDLGRNLAAGVDFNGTASTPDTVVVYEVSDFTTPMLLGRFNFPANQQANANHISKTVFAANMIYALDGNNGIAAFSLIPPVSVRPSLSIAQAGSQVLISWTNTLTGYTLYSDPAVNGAYATSEGPGTSVGNYFWVTNDVAGSGKFYRLRK